MNFEDNLKACLHPFPVLETPRLILRRFSSEDAKGIYQMRADGRVGRFIARENMNSPEDAGTLINRIEESYHNYASIAWMGVRKGKEEAIIGACGFNRIEIQNRRAEIGGEMDVQGWGKRYSAEALSTIIDFGINKLQLHSIEAKVSPLNKSAIYLLEQLGFQKEAHFREAVYFNGSYSDMAVYSLIK